MPKFFTVSVPFEGKPGLTRDKLVAVHHVVTVSEVEEGSCLIFLSNGEVLEPLETYNHVWNELAELGCIDPDEELARADVR